jgi:hypothetical protein
MVSSGGFVEPSGVFGPATERLPKSLFTGMSFISGLTITGLGNQTKIFNNIDGTATGGLAGNIVVTVLQALNLTIPLTAVGQSGASVQAGWPGFTVTLKGQGWTTGTATVTGITTSTPGGNVINTATLQGSNQLSEGRLTLVTGFRVVTSFVGRFPGFAIQALTFPDLLSDTDGDGDPDVFDNCPETPNADQTDTDRNEVGDACNDFEDLDGDEWADPLDNCPGDSNQDQADTDENGVGDACNSWEDMDGDEWANSLDNCPNDANVSQVETDGDTVGDACDPYPDDALNLQGLADLEAAQTAITGLQADLLSCEGDAAQCSASLAQAQSSLTGCNGDLSSCIGTATGLEADLLQTQTDLSQAQANITLLQADVTQLQSNLASTEAVLEETEADLQQTEAELTQTEAALAIATADADGDGVRDTADACAATAAGAEVDLIGCSHAQFCSGINASTGPGGATCNNSDWQNDEAREHNPDDCKAKQGVCVPLG